MPKVKAYRERNLERDLDKDTGIFSFFVCSMHSTISGLCTWMIKSFCIPVQVQLQVLVLHTFLALTILLMKWMDQLKFQ